jgi:hypothetical protein
MCGSTEEKMSVFFRACEIRRVVWRTSSSVETLSVDKAGAMMELRKDFRVWVAPSTRTAEMFMGVLRLSLIYTVLVGA